MQNHPTAVIQDNQVVPVVRRDATHCYVIPKNLNSVSRDCRALLGVASSQKSFYLTSLIK